MRKTVAPGNGNEKATRYLYDESQVIEERDGQDAVAREFVYGMNIDEPLVMINRQDAMAPRYYYHSDSIGSIQAVTDSSATISERYRYSAYGELMIVAPDGTERATSEVGNPYTFQGRRFDPETGLYYYRARYYSPVLGRFLQRDAEGYAEGLNLYLGLVNNPPNRIDPLGLQGWREWLKKKAAGVGSAIKRGGEAVARGARAMGRGAVWAERKVVDKAYTGEWSPSPGVRQAAIGGAAESILEGRHRRETNIKPGTGKQWGAWAVEGHISIVDRETGDIQLSFRAAAQVDLFRDVATGTAGEAEGRAIRMLGASLSVRAEAGQQRAGATVTEEVHGVQDYHQLLDEQVGQFGIERVRTEAHINYLQARGRAGAMVDWTRGSWGAEGGLEGSVSAVEAGASTTYTTLGKDIKISADALLGSFGAGRYMGFSRRGALLGHGTSAAGMGGAIGVEVRDPEEDENLMR